MQVHVEFFERYARGNKAYYSAGFESLDSRTGSIDLES
jgi:hypothetical protein